MNNPILIMHRIGDFAPGAITDNQCSECGKGIYHYRLVMAFHPEVKLDEKGFIFDSLELTELLCLVRPTGSCEQMHRQLSECIAQFFLERGIDVLAWKLAIVSKEKQENRSWFEGIDTFGEFESRLQMIQFISPHLI